MKNERERLTVGFEPELYENIKRIAAINGISMNQQIRNYCRTGVNGQVTADNIDELIQLMREQLRTVMNPYVERLTSLNAKTCIQAHTAALLCAETINRFVPAEKQEDVVEIYEKAKMKGIELVKGKKN